MMVHPLSKNNLTDKVTIKQNKKFKMPTATQKNPKTEQKKRWLITDLILVPLCTIFFLY